MPVLADPPVAAPSATEPHAFTVAELAERFGTLPAWRVRTKPYPGTVTAEHAGRLAEQGGSLCEWIDGTLVEKAASWETSLLETRIARFLGNFVDPRRLGWVSGPAGFVWLYGGDRLRAPDASFVRTEQLPGGVPTRDYPALGPALCVEVVSPDNTRQEMARKRREYFENGTELCWTVYPRTRTVEVHTAETGPDEGAGTVLAETETLNGGSVLPGFELALRELFAQIAPASEEAEA